MLYQSRQMLFSGAGLFKLALSLMIFMYWFVDVAYSSQLEKLRIISSSGTHEFQVEIADDPAEQMKGLMFRRSLADDRGMLFIYKDDKERSMWMKNTYISLDMLFIESDGTIFNIVRETEPFSEETIYSKGPGRAVLEVPGGTAERLGLKAGDRIEHKAFKR